MLAATALLGTAAAKVHKLKLDKVPLSEQFVRFLSTIRSSMGMMAN